MARVFTPSSNVAALRESATIAVSTRARELRAAGRRVIDLGAGEPDFDTPEFIRSAAAAAVEAGATRYTPVAGIPPLRAVIAERASARWRGPAIEPAEVVVSSGSKQSLFNACFVLFGPGDEVLVPTPAWTSYYEMLGLARATAVPVRGDHARGLKVSAETLAAAATPRTRGIVLNSPCNPTGSVYDRAELEAILALAEERDWWVIADEIYRRIAYGRPATSVLDVATRRDRLVVVDGVAKAYAMTGWRIGWAIAPAPVAAALTALQSHTTSGAAAPSQHAALAALCDERAADQAIGEMVRQFRGRRDAAMEVLASAPGLEIVPPEGAFYLFVNVAPAARESADPGSAFARRLLEQHDTAVVPGAAFLTPDWVRVSYAASVADVEAGVGRLVKVYREGSR